MNNTRNSPSFLEWIFIFGIFMRLTISNELLNNFINYTKSGGSEIFKIHPGTYVILFTFYFSLLFEGKNSKISNTQRKSIYFLILMLAITILQIIKFGLNSVSYLLDTFIIAAVSAIFLEKSSSAAAHILYRILISIIFINSLMAVFEFLLKTHFLPSGSFVFSHFRAQSILGHPLLNSLLTGTTLMLIISRRKFNFYIFGYIAISLLALLAFGGRASLITFVLFAVVALIGNLGKRLLIGRVHMIELISVPAIAVLMVGAIAYLVSFSEFGERFRDMAGTDNNSTIARLNILSIYSPLSYDEIAWGISPEIKQMLIEQNPYFNTIENFWIDISLSLGGVIFVVFVLGLFNFIFACARDPKLPLMAPLLFFLTVASTNNALSVKSSALLFFVALTVSARKTAQKHEIGVRI